jgi:hypothetical protein
MLIARKKATIVDTEVLAPLALMEAADHLIACSSCGPKEPSRLACSIDFETNEDVRSLSPVRVLAKLYGN